LAQFRVLTKGVEVNGETVLSVVDGLDSFKSNAFGFLSKNGISQPEAGK
jgi:hypothetical protein